MAVLFTQKQYDDYFGGAKLITIIATQNYIC